MPVGPESLSIAVLVQHCLPNGPQVFLVLVSTQVQMIG